METNIFLNLLNIINKNILNLVKFRKTLKFYNLCCLSILSCVYPLYIFYKNQDRSEEIISSYNKLELTDLDKSSLNIYKKVCCILNIGIIICGELFWINPVRNNIYHKIDRSMVRITFFYNVFYIFFIKSTSTLFRLQFLYNIFLFMIFFYISNYYSSKKWCSRNHIISHVIFHIISSRGLLYAYL